VKCREHPYPLEHFKGSNTRITFQPLLYLCHFSTAVALDRAWHEGALCATALRGIAKPFGETSLAVITKVTIVVASLTATLWLEPIRVTFNHYSTFCHCHQYNTIRLWLLTPIIGGAKSHKITIDTNSIT